RGPRVGARPGKRRGRARGARRQPVPLHGLHQDLRGGRSRGAREVRSWLAEFDVACPRALPEALALLGDGVTPLAGATDLFVLMNAGHLPATKLVSLHGVAELAAPARWEGDTYVMSALTTYTEARHDKRVTEDLPLLPL